MLKQNGCHAENGERRGYIQAQDSVAHHPGQVSDPAGSAAAYHSIPAIAHSVLHLLPCALSTIAVGVPVSFEIRLDIAPCTSLVFTGGLVAIPIPRSECVVV